MVKDKFYFLCLLSIWIEIAEDRYNIDALDALFAVIMSTYPYDELAIKSLAAALKYGPVPVPVPPQLSSSQASNGTGGFYFVFNNVTGNTFHATNSNRVGILGSFNEGANPEEGKLYWFWWQNYKTQPYWQKAIKFFLLLARELIFLLSQSAGLLTVLVLHTCL
ncbi:unnamed protein product [Prunus armeniaca]|uniref:Uncharacterized protein n=1 Tax=Prunus armeniaca TaxID=36596 RepID=A0A6J5VKM5_PRUAR|nr:unnamed protein product [Prunus armeniaca]